MKRYKTANGICFFSLLFLLFSLWLKDAHVFAVSIDGFLHTRLLDGDIERILADARDAGTCSAAIVWAIVVMTPC